LTVNGTSIGMMSSFGPSWAPKSTTMLDGRYEILTKVNGKEVPEEAQLRAVHERRGLICGRAPGQSSQFCRSITGGGLLWWQVKRAHPAAGRWREDYRLDPSEACVSARSGGPGARRTKTRQQNSTIKRFRRTAQRAPRSRHTAKHPCRCPEACSMCASASSSLVRLAQAHVLCLATQVDPALAQQLAAAGGGGPNGMPTRQVRRTLSAP